MAIFARLRDALFGGGDAGATALGPARDRAERRGVAFTIAAIALAAKMAGADGRASAAEYAAFERLFHVEPSERANARRFWELARGTTAGFEAYADQAARALGPGSPALEDLFDALLAIAAVEGFKPEELAYLSGVAARFGFSEAQARRLFDRCRLCPQTQPWEVLGVPRDASPDAIRAAYRRLAREHHPDRHLAEGVPSEFIRVAEARMAAINAAYAALTRGAR
jgi:DnaJ like chaperone protein